MTATFPIRPNPTKEIKKGNEKKQRVQQVSKIHPPSNQHKPNHVCINPGCICSIHFPYVHVSSFPFAVSDIFVSKHLASSLFCDTSAIVIVYNYPPFLRDKKKKFIVRRYDKRKGCVSVVVVYFFLLKTMFKTSSKPARASVSGKIWIASFAVSQKDCANSLVLSIPLDL